MAMDDGGSHIYGAAAASPDVVRYIRRGYRCVATHMAKPKQRMQVQCMHDEQMEQSED